jgi:hypothetical protein
MGRYLQPAQLYAYLFGTSGTIPAGGGTISADQQALMGSAINEAERFIDDHTRRNFAGSAGTMYYNRYTQQTNLVGQAFYLDEDLHSLTGLVNGDGQVIPTGSVWLEPRDKPPYRILKLKSQYAWVWNTDSDMIISGTWGFSTTPPAAIVGATEQLAAYYYRLKDVGPGDVSGFPEGGEVTYSKGIPDTVKYLLSPYRSRSGGRV